MWLFRKKIKRWSINHPLGRIAPKKIADPKRIEELTIRLRAGDHSVCDELLKAHMRLAIYIAAQYATLAPAKAQDLVSEAMLGIVEALDRAEVELYDNNIGGWIVANVHRRCHNFLRTDHLINVPATADIRPAVIGSINEKSKMVTKKVSKVGEIKEILEKAIDAEDNLVKKELKKKIVELRAIGYDDTEIAEILKLSKQYVWLLRNEIRKKYERLERE